MYKDDVLMFPDRDLPEGANRITGKLLGIINEAYDALVMQNMDPNMNNIDYKDIFSGMKFIDSGDTKEETSRERLRLFNGNTNPIVGEYIWYRGIGVSVDEGTVLFYLPWPRDENAYPAIYSLGIVSLDSIERILRKYLETLEKVLELVPEPR